MKIRNKIAGIISVICIAMSFGIAHAEQHEINYIKSIDGDYINISGTAVNGGGAEVFIRIGYADKALSDNITDLENYIIYQKQMTVSSDGSFAFKVKLKDIGSSPYSLRLGVMGDDADVSEEFIFYGENYRKEALGAIREAQKNKDADALARAVNTYYKNLYLNTPVFDKYYGSDPQLSQIKSMLISYPAITTISGLEAALEGSVIVKELKQAEDYTGMEEVFDKYNTTLGINTQTIYSLTYSKLSDKLKGSVYDVFIKKQYYTPSDIRSAFTVAVLNSYLKNAIGAASIRQVLSDNAQLFDIDMANYNLSDAKFLSLIGSEFTSVAEVKTKLEQLKKAPNNTTSGGGGSSGSNNSYTATSVYSALNQNSVTRLMDIADYPFDDMENHVWAKKATLALYSRGVLHGVGDRSFAPDRVITREEFLKLIINGFEMSAAQDNDISFTDTDKNEWYYPFIKTGVNCGIIKGMDNNRFGIGSRITRQDLVVILYRAMGMKKDMANDVSLSEFKDYDAVSDYAKAAVVFAESTYIVSGMGDGNFHPQENATRAETAVILYRAIEYMANNR